LKPAIVHAAGFAAPHGGNFVASMRALAGSCEEQGWVFVLALPPSAAKMGWCARLIAEGYQVRFLPDSASVLSNAWALGHLAVESDAVLIHTHFSQYDVAAWVACFLLRIRRRHVRVVWHTHSDFPDRATPLRWAKNVLKYRFMGRAVRMIAVSEHIRERTVKAGFDAAAVVTIRNGIDLARASAATRSRAQMYEELHIPSDRRMLLLFGWEPTVKGVDVAMNAVGALVGMGLPVVLAVVGTAPLREFVLRASNGEPPPWVRIVPPTDHVADLYQAASVFVSASRNEGFPYSICEALANHLPVVVSDLPGVSWARRASGAVFFPSGDSTALAEAVRVVLSWSAEESERRALASEHLVKAEFEVVDWVDRILELYREMLGSCPERPPV
jgi:glycosyltransferase involved in cell wall biosynthesis